MTTMLVVGVSEGNIADDFVDLIMENEHHDPMIDRLWCPDMRELDVRSDFSIRRAVREQGPFDEIVYCAGVNNLTWLQDITSDALYQHFAVNYFGWVLLLAAHRRSFPDHPFRAVVLSSDAAKVPMRGSLMYNSSKAALQFSIKNIARELAPHCEVVGVAPCIVEDTPMTEYIDRAVPEFRGWTPEQARAYEVSNLPIGRRISKREVAEAMYFALTGPSGMTGSTIEITGGR